MIDFKDLTGLSDPLKRLIEVVAEGIGAISRPHFIKKNADAKAYEIRTIAQAMADSQGLIGAMKYGKGDVEIDSVSENAVGDEKASEIGQRVLMRISYQQAKKQVNIENLIQVAVDELQSEETVSDAKPDKDWITRFFNISEDVSSDQMQILWGKILAGEIKSPGSYSLRTLELLKNINQSEAKLFVKLANITFEGSEKLLIPYPDNGKFLLEKFGISFNDLLILREVGLLVMNDLELSLAATNEPKEIMFTIGNNCILIQRPKDAPKQSLKCIAFTEIGKQLYRLIEPSPVEYDYIKYFAKFWRREEVVIKSGVIVERNDDQIRYKNLKEVPE